MSQWGIALLCAYIFLGVCRTTWRKAGYLALILTAAVIGVVMVNYMKTAPTVPASSVVQVTGSSLLPKVNVTGGPYIPPDEDKTGRAFAIQSTAPKTPVQSGCGSLPGGPIVTPSGSPPTAATQPDRNCPTGTTTDGASTGTGGAGS